MAWSAVALRDGPCRMPFDLSHIVCDLAGFLALETDFDPKEAGGQVAHPVMALELQADDAPTTRIECAHFVFGPTTDADDSDQFILTTIHIKGFGRISGDLLARRVSGFAHLDLAETDAAETPNMVTTTKMLVSVKDLPPFLRALSYLRTTGLCVAQDGLPMLAEAQPVYEGITISAKSLAKVLVREFSPHASVTLRFDMSIERGHHPVPGLMLWRGRADKAADGTLWGMIYDAIDAGAETKHNGPQECGWVPIP